MPALPALTSASTPPSWCQRILYFSSGACIQTSRQLLVVHSLASTLCRVITCCGLHLLQETQKEILVYAHEACHVFPGLEEQCEMYVNMYGPLVMGIIQQYLQPDAMCGRLGFCPLPPALH